MFARAISSSSRTAIRFRPKKHQSLQLLLRPAVRHISGGKSNSNNNNNNTNDDKENKNHSHPTTSQAHSAIPQVHAPQSELHSHGLATPVHDATHTLAPHPQAHESTEHQTAVHNVSEQGSTELHASHTSHLEGDAHESSAHSEATHDINYTAKELHGPERDIFIVQQGFTTSSTVESVLSSIRPGWSVHWQLFVGKKLETTGKYAGYTVHLTTDLFDASAKAKKIGDAGSSPYGKKAHVVSLSWPTKQHEERDLDKYKTIKIGHTTLSDRVLDDIAADVTKNYKFEMHWNNCQVWIGRVLDRMERLQPEGKQLTFIDHSPLPSMLKDQYIPAGVVASAGIIAVATYCFLTK